jgi:hypothetical protein
MDLTRCFPVIAELAEAPQMCRECVQCIMIVDGNACRDSPNRCLCEHSPQTGNPLRDVNKSNTGRVRHMVSQLYYAQALSALLLAKPLPCFIFARRTSQITPSPARLLPLIASRHLIPSPPRQRCRVPVLGKPLSSLQPTFVSSNSPLLAPHFAWTTPPPCPRVSFASILVASSA